MRFLSEYLFGPQDFWLLIRWAYRRARGFSRMTWLKLGAIFLVELILLFGTEFGPQGLFFWGFVLATFLFDWDDRVPITFALAGLILIPFLLILKQYTALILADLWAEEVAVWVFFFLVIGVVRQAYEIWRERLIETLSPSPTPEEQPLPKQKPRSYPKTNRKGKRLTVPHLRLSRPGFSRLLPLCVLFLLPFLIMWPFYNNGYLFLLDMMWGSEVFKNTLSQNVGLQASFPLHLILNGLSIITSVAIVQQLLLTLVLALAAFSAYALARQQKLGAWALLSSVLFVFNPYVYERFLAGHYLVLLGYAFFPLLLLAFTAFLRAPQWRTAMVFFGLATVAPILSLHWAYLAAGFLAVYAGISFLLAPRPQRRQLLTRTLPLLLGGLVVAAVLNLFWLQGDSRTQTQVGSFSAADFEAFQTQPDPQFGAIFNVLALYGFWQDDFILPKHLNAFWWAYALLTVFLAAVGLFTLIRRRQTLGVTLAVLFLPILLVAVGYGSTLTRPLIDLLLPLPGFAGLRETQKLAGLIALTYALAVPAALQAGAKRFSPPRDRQAAALLGMSFLFCVLVQMAPMLSGFAGQLRPSDYPSSWYAAADTLKAAGAQKLLFVPWTGYQPLPFADGRVTANPASAFFSLPVVKGSAFENGFLEAESSPAWESTMFSLLNSEPLLSEDVAFLHAEGITHIAMAKINDYERYHFLWEYPEAFTLIYNSPEIAIYELSPLPGPVPLL